jgi:hypothetical protein
MILSLIFPTEGSNLLSLCRVYSGITATAMITGHSMLGAASSGLAVYVLQENAYRASSPKDGEALDRWILLSSISALAGLASWVLLLLSTYKTDEAQAYTTHFFGYAIQKLWALFLGYILLQDLRLNMAAADSSPGSGSAKNKPRPVIRRQSSLAIFFYEIRIRIVEGRDLVAKDTNLFGRKTTSDPYVIAHFGPNQIGKTPIVPKTLDPVWPKHLLRLAVLPKSLDIYKEIKLYIYDHDNMSSDDAMGTVFVPVPFKRDVKLSKWFKVHKGSGESFCHDAKGELLVEISIITT